MFILHGLIAQAYIYLGRGNRLELLSVGKIEYYNYEGKTMVHLLLSAWSSDYGRLSTMVSS